MRLKFNVDTKILFQIGDPLDHSSATYVHNAVYEYANLNAVNLSVIVKKGELGKFIEAAQTIGAVGFDITTPHKTDILPFLDECEPISKAFKSVDHVKFRDGKLIGIGLDGVGMGISIEKAIGSVAGKKVLLIGAGSVSGPVAADLCSRGVKELCIVNRTLDKAEFVAETLRQFYTVNTKVGPLTDEFLNAIAPDIGLVIQCTSVGLNNDTKVVLPMAFINYLPKDCVVADVLYPTTVFLEEAKKHGLFTVNGSGMLAEQDVVALNFHFGIKLPPEAALDAEEAVYIGAAMKNLRKERLEKHSDLLK